MADDEITAALAEIRKREQQASPGPWKVTREHGYDMDDAPWSLPSVAGPDGSEILLGFVDQPGADLRFAAHAREDVPRLLKAVEAVLELHTEAVIEEARPPFHYCSRCSGHPKWPCPEVRAILAALTGEGKAGD